MNSFWLIEDYIFANDFLRFWQVILKKRKKSCFLKSEKNVKYVFSYTGLAYADSASVHNFVAMNIHRQNERRIIYIDSVADNEIQQVWRSLLVLSSQSIAKQIGARPTGRRSLEMRSGDNRQRFVSQTTDTRFQLE